MAYVKTTGELYHHGILGQKWGQRNGPPYPLKPGVHSTAEKRAGWKKSVDDSGSVKKYTKKTAGGMASYRIGNRQYEVELDDEPNEVNDAERQRKIKIATGAAIGVGAAVVTAASAYGIYRLQKSGYLAKGKEYAKNLIEKAFGAKRLTEVIKEQDIKVMDTPPVLNATKRAVREQGERRAKALASFAEKTRSNTTSRGSSFWSKRNSSGGGYAFRSRPKSNRNMSIDELNEMLLRRNASRLRA